MTPAAINDAHASTVALYQQLTTPPPAPPPPVTRVRFDQVLAGVATFYNTTTAHLVGPQRHRSIVHPRQVCMYLARRLTLLSQEEVGDRLGGRDHTTVMHGVRQVEARMGADPEWATQVRQVEWLIVGSGGTER